MVGKTRLSSLEIADDGQINVRIITSAGGVHRRVVAPDDDPEAVYAGINESLARDGIEELGAHQVGIIREVAGRVHTKPVRDAWDERKRLQAEADAIARQESERRAAEREPTKAELKAQLDDIQRLIANLD
jgi:hypothetical protein